MAQKSIGIFISSKMIELHDERKALEELLPNLGDETTQIHTWIFESDALASDSSIRATYMKALDDSELYIGLFWNDYGEWTIDEFHHAGELGITRHIYVKDGDSAKRDKRLQDFLHRQTDVRFGITPRWFKTVDDLLNQVRRSVQQWLVERQIASHSSTSAIIATISDDIPELPRRFVGREDLIEDVQELLDDNEHILLHGFGGMGKSALAATIAAQRIDENKGIVIWIRMGAAEADSVFEAIGHAFGQSQQIASVTGVARNQAIRHLLTENKGLLVLDDVWNGNALSQVVKALPRQMPLLVTSRQRFPLDEIIEVGRLSKEEALKILIYHSRQRDLKDSKEAEQLCDVLGYHAFALEIAGKTMKVYNFTPSELLLRIEETPHDLSMPAGFGELGRKGIKSLLDASVDVLSKELYDAFFAFGGMFEPSTTAELLALVMQCETEDIEHRLQELTQRGLVNVTIEQETPLYRLHDLAYSYVRTMYQNKDISPQPVIEACLQYVQNNIHHLEALDLEQNNILEAAEAAYQSGYEHILLDIMRMLTVDGNYFAATGHTTLSLKLTNTAIDIALEKNELEVAHYLLSRLGNTYADYMGNLELAYKTYHKALQLAQKLNNPNREAVLLTVIGTVRFRQREDDADHYHLQAEQITKENDDQAVLAQILHNRGLQLMQQPLQPNYELGCQLSDEAITIAKENNLTAIHFWSLVNRGGGELELGKTQEALNTHLEAYQLAKSVKNYYWMAGAAQAIGEDYHRTENHVEAQNAFQESLSLWQQVEAKAMIDDLKKFMLEHEYTIPKE